jgi:hypothetical protein
MNQSASDRDAKVTSLLEALLEDARASSANEIRDEITANGGDPDRVVTEMRAMTLGLVQRSKKSLLHQVQSQWKRHSSTVSSLAGRQPGRIRERLRQLVSGNESFASSRVALAFRNGVTQSDNDLLSLWQDLVDLGAVSDDELRD